MQEYQKRLVEEQHQLEQKIQALYVFLATDHFDRLESEEQTLLKSQYYAMKVYSSILERRILDFV